MASKSKTDGGFVELVKTIVYALILAGFIRTLLFQPFWIPSGSMKDTLLVGDFLFVNKFAYGYSKHSCPWSLCPFSGRIWAGEPDRGDVIVFNQGGTVFIKRLIGLPGDEIQMRDGVLFINDVEAKQTPLEPFVEKMATQGPMRRIPSCANAPVSLEGGGDCIKERAAEALPDGPTHNVLNIATRSTDDTLVYKVPEGNYFFMGDNRDNSTDSRISRQGGGVGYVPFENLIGRADRIMFSSAGSSILSVWAWRSDRYFKAIN